MRLWHWRKNARPFLGMRRRGWSIALAGCAVLAIGLWVVLGSSALAVHTVRVTGAPGVLASDIEDASQPQRGRPLAMVNVQAVAERVADRPEIASVHVVRAWPNTLAIETVARTPRAFLAAGDRAQLVDGNGVVYRTVEEPARGLPELHVASPGPSDPATVAAMQALESVSAVTGGADGPQLPSPVVEVSAQGSSTVRLRLADGRQVVWGDSDHGKRKTRVLVTLLSQPGAVYDVSSPELATIRR